MHTAPSTLKPGDQVLVRQTKVNKLTPTYNPSQLTVTARQGSWVMCKDSNGKQIKRNIIFFKPLPFLRPDDAVESNSTDDDEEDESIHASANNTPAKDIKLVVEAAGASSSKKINMTTPANSGHHVKIAAARTSKSLRKQKAKPPSPTASSPGQSPGQGSHRIDLNATSQKSTIKRVVRT